MNFRKQEILKSDPYEREKSELEMYESNSHLFYKALSQGTNLELGSFDLNEIQVEVLKEIFILFQREIKEFEREIKENPKAVEKFNIIFLSKEKFYQRVLQRFSKYLSIITYGDIRQVPNLNIKMLKNFLKKGFKEMIEVAVDDIPKYELLFNELDDLSSSNKKTELYIGRDGIYAYEARRAIDVAKRRKLTGDKIKRRKALEIHPKYINYNSTIKENFKEEDRRRYLQDNGVYPEDDLIIFDTGYRGSIPEQILKTLGRKDYDDIQSRVKILGTDFYEGNEDVDLAASPEEYEKALKYRSRIIKGIKNNLANYEHVGRIEERGKKYMTATGIFEDKNGKLKPAENPFFNEYFFEYELIELVIRQYFYNREFYK